MPHKVMKLLILRYSGIEGSRTPDLIHAMDALSQLSYDPVMGKRYFPKLPCGNVN